MALHRDNVEKECFANLRDKAEQIAEGIEDLEKIWNDPKGVTGYKNKDDAKHAIRRLKTEIDTIKICVQRMKLSVQKDVDEMEDFLTQSMQKYQELQSEYNSMMSLLKEYGYKFDSDGSIQVLNTSDENLSILCSNEMNCEFESTFTSMMLKNDSNFVTSTPLPPQKLNRPK